MTDEELLKELSGGHASALETLAYRYHAAIRAYLFRLLQSRTLADDLTQECFIRVITSVKQGRLPEKFRPWLYKIATNLCRDHWRKAVNRMELVSDEGLLHVLAPDNVAHIYEKQVDRELVIQALNELPAERRHLMILRFYQELKLEEIADILDIPLSTVKSRLYYGIKQLNRMLSGDDRSSAQCHAAKEANGNER
ncbi:ECF RNA polymerase sigma factor SigW [Paenibacillus plantiphilus]|uniref:ECF RNA polymerase sigma factor SigW n=1 Tax=Paenibacillus plantiphilus TaxID=2905650 RepID=A0ABM9CE87_9BACL|nr:RNA polymerase sigma factor [Paenibacillus plantiphilus]CAH1209702.1 ECF RNA polymerase sigma factor SigW [Paenibacillus plantiphilus]